MASAADRSEVAKSARRANLRMAAALLGIAAVFFGGIIASQYTGATGVGIAVIGLGVVGFLATAVSRRSRRPLGP